MALRGASTKISTIILLIIFFLMVGVEDFKLDLNCTFCHWDKICELRKLFLSPISALLTLASSVYLESLILLHDLCVINEGKIH